MPQRVADEVRDDDVHSPGIDRRRDRGQVGVDEVGPASCPQRRPHHLGHVDVVQHEQRGAGVEPADLHQFVHQPAEVAGFPADQPSGLAEVLGQPIGVLVEHVGHRCHRGERGAQLVRHVGGEALGVRFHRVQPGHVLLQLRGRVVEGVRHPGQFVGAVHGHPGPQISLAQPSRRVAELADRAQHSAHDQQCHHDRGQQGRRADQPGARGELLDAALLFEQVVGLVDLDPGRPDGVVRLHEQQRCPDEQDRPPAARHPLPREFTALHRAAQLRGNRVRVQAVVGVVTAVDGDRGAVPIVDHAGDLVERGPSRRGAR